MAVTDLTGYTWVGNNSITHSDNPTKYLQYDLNFDCNSNSYTTFVFQFLYKFDQSFYSLNFDSLQVYINDGVGWSNQAYKTIQITGGTDATNSTLIAWLEANGTLTAPLIQEYELRINGTLTDKYQNQTINELHYNGNDYKIASVYSITNSITNGTASGASAISSIGTATITITANSGYTLPSSITVSGAIYTYNDTTGVVTLSNATGNVTISAVCEAQVSGYSVSGHAGDIGMIGSEAYQYSDIGMIGSEAYQYSIDDGTTWNNFTLLGNNLFTPITTTQIKFRVKLFAGMEKSAISSTTLNCNITSHSSTYVYSSNYILDQNINDVILDGRY